MTVVKITKSFVEKTPHNLSGQLTFADEDLPGFYLVVGKRSKTFVVQKDMNGRTRRKTIGKYPLFTVQQARAIAIEHLRSMAQGTFPEDPEKADQDDELTLKAIVESYIRTNKNLKPSTKKDYTYYISLYLATWENRPLTDITTTMVCKRHGEITEQNGKSTANKTMRILSALFNHAYAVYDVCPNNPVHILTKARAWNKERRRTNHLKPSQIQTWLAAVRDLENDTYRDYLITLLLTGMRRSEAAGLLWENVDFTERTLHIPETKNGDSLTLPLSTYLYDMLQARRETYPKERFVFPGSGKSGHLQEPKKALWKIYADTGIHVTCHDLRRTYATIAESLDLSAFTIKCLLNHKTRDVTAGYIISGVDRLRGPVELIAQKIVNGG